MRWPDASVVRRPPGIERRSSVSDYFVGSTCICPALSLCLCTIPARAAEPSVALPAFELIDSAGNTVAPVFGATVDPDFGAVLLVRFYDVIHSRSLLLMALAGGPGSSPTDNGIFPPMPISEVTLGTLSILYSQNDCTGGTYIDVPAGLFPGVLHIAATTVIYSAGVCASDGSKICIYSAQLPAPAVSANTASKSLGVTSCTTLSPALRTAVPAVEVIKINSPFPWEIK